MNEGATSVPWQSGLVAVVEVGQCVNYSDGFRTCHLHATRSAGDRRGSRPGDSGGPWVFYSSFGPLAVGQHVAGDGGTGSSYHPVDILFGNNVFGMGLMAVNT